MHRFFIEQINENENLLWLSPEESRHAIGVLRLKEGNKIFVFDATGNEFEARISTIQSKNQVQVELLAKQFFEPASIELLVAQGFLQKHKMDWIVEKACEIGVGELIPLETEFSMMHLSSEAFRKVKNRWHKILLGAAKQSGNVRMSRLADVTDFDSFLENLPGYEKAFLFHSGKDAEINVYPAFEEVRALIQKRKEKKPFRLLIFIGPEGGFSKNEVESAKQKGIRSVGLGKNILRAETAFAVISGWFKIFLT
ncbi:MAG: 16S rRNA (uracil(1498)-N(3))-methyltransferase [Candidatus Omnitrophica bacterium]|nr:16S rRNA (uracil(1498)-N(3))-methyltransferase [Candidatus Omnitrophota bacterium]